MWWALLIGLIMAFYFYVKKKFNYFSSIGVPHQPGTFPFGSDVTWKMFSGKISFVKIVDEIYDEFKDTNAKIGGYYGMLGSPTFVPIGNSNKHYLKIWLIITPCKFLPSFPYR